MGMAPRGLLGWQFARPGAIMACRGGLTTTVRFPAGEAAWHAPSAVEIPLAAPVPGSPTFDIVSPPGRQDGGVRSVAAADPLASSSLALGVRSKSAASDDLAVESCINMGMAFSSCVSGSCTPFGVGTDCCRGAACGGCGNAASCGSCACRGKLGGCDAIAGCGCLASTVGNANRGVGTAVLRRTGETSTLCASGPRRVAAVRRGSAACDCDASREDDSPPS